MLEQQKSANWDARKDVKSDVRKGYPYNEGFPKEHIRDNKILMFELITHNGETCTAYVDFSNEYRAAEPRWRKLTGAYVDENIVIAWREAE